MVENPSSRSKAQNVNYALDMIEARPGAVIAIYDADHHPDPDAVGYALATMDRTSCKVVQGHCAIRNVDEGFLPGARRGPPTLGCSCGCKLPTAMSGCAAKMLSLWDPVVWQGPSCRTPEPMSALHYGSSRLQAIIVLTGLSACPGVIGAEFEEVYQTVHEGRARFWNMGLFGGSNGYWDSATLKVRHTFWSQPRLPYMLTRCGAIHIVTALWVAHMDCLCCSVACCPSEGTCLLLVAIPICQPAPTAQNASQTCSASNSKSAWTAICSRRTSIRPSARHCCQSRSATVIRRAFRTVLGSMEF